MAIYHLSVKIIGRGSGRSAIGSAAYRAGEKLRLVEKAAYRAGAELRDEETERVYDYTKKGGVVHKEIILPEGAPREYQDRETLWNVVEAKEKRKDARLAREIEIALQTEFDLKENIELLREYAKENFVDKGMIVDFVIHNNEGNPHSHIMLTTREVTPEGFGKKNRDWDKEENILIWRENWARINNRKFEEKGLEERIDHRTLKAQGIDREPTIHIGHEAWALEKKGIRTERGDYNREVKRRNDERAMKAEAERRNDPQDSNVASDKKPSALKKWGGSAERDALMAAKRNIREIEAHLKAEKAEQIVGKLQEQRAAREEAEKIAEYMDELRGNYITLDKELNTLKDTRDEANYHIPSLTFRAENIDEQSKNIETLQNRFSILQAERKKAHFWEKQLKQDLDIKIEHTEGELRIARVHFKVHYGIEPEQAPQEIKRIEEKIKTYTDNLKKAEQIPELSKKLKAIEKEYHKQKLLAQISPDSERIDKLLEQKEKLPETVRDRLQYESINRRLNVIAEENVEDIIKDFERQESKKVRDMLARYREEQARIRERELERERIRERNRTIERSR